MFPLFFNSSLSPHELNLMVIWPLDKLRSSSSQFSLVIKSIHLTLWNLKAKKVCFQGVGRAVVLFSFKRMEEDKDVSRGSVTNCAEMLPRLSLPSSREPRSHSYFTDKGVRGRFGRFRYTASPSRPRREGWDPHSGSKPSAGTGVRSPLTAPRPTLHGPMQTLPPEQLTI